MNDFLFSISSWHANEIAVSSIFTLFNRIVDSWWYTIQCIQYSNIFGFGIEFSFDRQRYTSIRMRCKIHEHGRFDGDFKSGKFVLHAFWSSIKACKNPLCIGQALLWILAAYIWFYLTLHTFKLHYFFYIRSYIWIYEEREKKSFTH